MDQYTETLTHILRNHRAKIEVGAAQNHHQKNREQRIKVIRNGGNKRGEVALKRACDL